MWMDVKLESEHVGDNASVVSDVKSEVTDEYADDAVDRLIKCEENDESIKQEVNDEINIPLVKDQNVGELHDGPKEKTHKCHICPVCDKIFDKPSQLKRHTMIHTREKNYHCEVCNKSFTANFTMMLSFTRVCHHMCFQL